MLIHNLKIFDDYIPPSDYTTPSITGDEWNEVLGRCNAISLMAVVDDITGSGSGTFLLFLIESMDNRHWFVRNQNSPGTATSTFGDMSIASMSPGGQYVRMFAHGCRGFNKLGTANASGPLMPFVRVSMFATTLRAHVKLYAACRAPSRW